MSEKMYFVVWICNCHGSTKDLIKVSNEYGINFVWAVSEDEAKKSVMDSVKQQFPAEKGYGNHECGVGLVPDITRRESI